MTKQREKSSVVLKAPDSELGDLDAVSHSVTYWW